MSQEKNLESRIATPSDLDDLTATLTAAFERDPLWSWVFPDPKNLEIWWRLHIASALRYPCVWITDDFGAASVWIPPDGTELTEEEEQRIEPLLTELVGTRAPLVLEVLELFETSHPRERPHYYLSLLGVRPDQRGKGLGMALLAQILEQLDSEKAPSYLDQAIRKTTIAMSAWGFRQVGDFTTPDGERTVTTMWREVQAGTA